MEQPRTSSGSSIHGAFWLWSGTVRKVLFGSMMAAALTIFGLATPAHAATLDIDYTLSSSDELSDGAGTGCGPAVGQYYSTTRPLHVTAAGSYQLVAQIGTSGDSFAILYTEPFDPALPTAGCRATTHSIPTHLDANTTYWINLSTDTPEVVGDFRISIDGPGDIILSPAPTPTLTLLTIDPTTITIGQTATITAHVTGATPTGSIDFSNGSDPIGTVTLTAGEAMLTYTPTVPGTHTITASYPGDSNNGPSQSTTAALVVNPAPTPVSSPMPELAESGYDPLPLGIAALTILGIGVALLAHRRNKPSRRADGT